MTALAVAIVGLVGALAAVTALAFAYGRAEAQRGDARVAEAMAEKVIASQEVAIRDLTSALKRADEVAKQKQAQHDEEMRIERGLRARLEDWKHAAIKKHPDLGAADLDALAGGDPGGPLAGVLGEVPAGAGAAHGDRGDDDTVPLRR